MRRRKPDLLLVIATLVGLGVLFTGLTQGVMRDSAEPAQLSSVAPQR